MKYLVPQFESLKKDLLNKGYNMHLSSKMDCLVNEIAMIFGNQSLVMLKEGDHYMAILSARQSVSYFPTEKVNIHTAIWTLHKYIYMSTFIHLFKGIIKDGGSKYHKNVR